MAHNTPNIFAFIALFGMVPLTVLLLAVLPARRAIVASAIGAWLCLPPINVDLPGLPSYNKATAAAVGILLGTLVLEPNRLLTFRLRWFDLPMLLWGLCPFVSSISNDLGIYDGLAAAFRQLMYWVLPYLVGRLYLTDLAGMRELALGMIIGGVCLIPLCLFEFRMSPQLMWMVYGFSYWSGLRYGGYRPRVFFQSSLELGLWMHAATLVAWWFWRAGQFRRLGSFSSGAVVAALLAISVWCKTTGATLLFCTGMAALWISWRTRTKWLLWGLLAAAPIYYTVRITDTWSGSSAVELARSVFNEDRAQSLEFRLDNEDLLIAKAMHRPFFGWGGWGRNFVYDEYHVRATTVDGTWIVVLGSTGCIGLILMATAMLLPAVLFLARFPVEWWDDPTLAPAVVIAVVVDLYLLDGLMNGMLNVIYIIAAGGLLNIVPAHVKPRATTSGRSVSTREELIGRYQTLGRSLKDQGQFAEAKVAWLNALELLTEQMAVDPVLSEDRQQWCDCANNLAWFFVTVPELSLRDPARAFSLAAKAVEAQPDCSTYWNTLGVVHYRASDFNAAVTALNRARILNEGGTAFDHVFLAMAYSKLGNQEVAQHWLTQAILWMEQYSAGHAELHRLCDEAKLTLAAGANTSAAAS
jgi:tetratricopeptide (TPR) repeat protein